MSAWHLARRSARMNPSIIREILKLTERPGVRSMAGGLPSADTFPVQAIRDACDKVLRDAPREALQYAASAPAKAARPNATNHGDSCGAAALPLASRVIGIVSANSATPIRPSR